MLKINNLSTHFNLPQGIVKAVDDISFYLNKGETLGLVGQSGSGKSTVALSILRLISPPGKIVSGEILLDGIDLLKISEKEMINIRGIKIGMIFQDPFTSLNPVFTVGEQIAEIYRFHTGLSKPKAHLKAVEMMDAVKIKEPHLRVLDYPHQFSGGMRQRIVIAMALAGHPEILLADEPTTALDVTTQLEILELLQKLQKDFNLAIIYITHNAAIVRKICQRQIVMQKGKII